MDRRTSLRLLATASLAPGLSYGRPVSRVAVQARKPSFFNEHEFQTVQVLADLTIPADGRSGSASDAGVPEFIDFMMTDQPELQLPMRGGLAWLDAYARRRFDAVFVEAGKEQQRDILDVIAYPDVAGPELSQGVAFFSRFRDLVAAGFWSSKTGVEDLRYVGNLFVREWTGCPRAATDALGVTLRPVGC